jgi:di/tricarboxylate transporter
MAPVLPKKVVVSSRKQVNVRAQAAAGAAPSKDAGFKWGANMRDLAISIGIGTLLWFAPAPAGVSAKAWHLLAVFVGTIVGIITTPLPLGAVAVLGLGAAMLTKVLTFPEAFSAFSSEIP